MSGSSKTLAKPTSVTQYTIRQMTLISCLATLSIVGRVYMASIPNVQPSTMIIIVSSLVFGIRFGLTLTVITVLGSNLVLGLGIHAIMQVIAWGVVAIVSGAMKSFYERVPHILMATFSGVTGFLYGFTVSLNMLLILGPIGFYTYWLAGIPFDLNHAVGNFVFYLSAAPVLLKILSDQKNRL